MGLRVTAGLRAVISSRMLEAAVLSSLLVTLSACSAVAPRPLGPRPSGAAPTVAAVLRVLTAQDQALSRFRAQAKLDFSSAKESFRSTQVVAVRAPAGARIDVMNPFGVSYTVATDGVELFAYDRRKSVYYKGSAETASFHRFLGIPMGARELTAMLRGLPPALGEQRWGSVDAVEGGWRLSRRLGSGGILEFVVDPTTFLPVRVKISGDRDRHEVEVYYSDYRDVTGVKVPHLIEASFKDESHLELVYKSVEREVRLPEEAFRIEQPAGARFVNFDVEGGGGT
jgi:outer membrane lipoprotein-sorting protein